jgi:hypothetical protein
VKDRVDEVEDTLHSGEDALEDALEGQSTLRHKHTRGRTYLDNVGDAVEEVGHGEGVKLLLCDVERVLWRWERKPKVTCALYTFRRRAQAASSCSCSGSFHDVIRTRHDVM